MVWRQQRCERPTVLSACSAPPRATLLTHAAIWCSRSRCLSHWKRSVSLEVCIPGRDFRPRDFMAQKRANRRLHKSCDGHMSSRVKKCGTVFRKEGSLVQLEKVSVRLVGACLRLGSARMELLRSFLTEIRMRMEGKGEKLYDPSGSPS